MTWTADAARDRNRATIVYLVDVQLLNGGPLLRLSDRNVISAGIVYSDYIAGVSGLGDSLSRATSGFASSPISMTFRNDSWHDGTTAYTHLSEMGEDFPFEGAPVTVKQVFLDDDGTPSAAETLFVGNLDSPQQITGIAFTCQVMTREAFASQRNR